MSDPSSNSEMDRSAVNPRLRIEYISITSLVPDPRNPRVHTREQVRAIAKSIQAFGYNTPLLVENNSRVVAGHGRLEAAKFLGMTEVPVIRLEHLTEAQAKAYMLADNKLTDRSSWDDQLLAVCLKDLQEMAVDFEIEATGFESPEIDFRIQSLELADKADTADEFEVPDEPAVSKLGDLWQLGLHRLICGNALEPDIYKMLLGEDVANCVFTDSPYNVRVNGHAGGKGRKKHREFPMASGEMTPSQFQDFLSGFMAVMMPHLDPKAVLFLCMDWRHMTEITSAITRNGCEMINLCVWVKHNGGMGSLYRSAHELVFVVRQQNAQNRNNVQLGRFGRNRTNVWHYAGMNSFSRQGKGQGLAIHPTVKPLAMVSDALLDVSKRGDLVLDSFVGSGTTILAAERTGRRGCGIELDPRYVDVAIRRWQQMTGQLAVHASGKTFAEIAAARENADADD